MRSLPTAGLFAGVGGIELGLQRAGHETRILCENDEGAQAVLRHRFPDTPIHPDIRTLRRLPAGTELLAGGFPCQDLSQAGMTKGIAGARSGLIADVLRLLKRHRTPWVLLENVPFMLQLGKGRALNVIVSALEELGYSWAYRVVNAMAFGLPQRRRRVYLIASLADDPRTVLFADDEGPVAQHNATRKRVACGFYWTEGIRGLGWAVNAVPTLKGGSTVGVPSPPAIWLPSGLIAKPHIRDAERLQGFKQNWTLPAEQVVKRGMRWKLVGNAVSVPVITWIGRRLATPGNFAVLNTQPVVGGKSWPSNAWNVGEGRYTCDLSEYPVQRRRKNLYEFLLDDPEPLSTRATAGFLARTKRSSLRFPDGFIDAIRTHLARMERAAI